MQLTTVRKNSQQGKYYQQGYCEYREKPVRCANVQYLNTTIAGELKVLPVCLCTVVLVVECAIKSQSSYGNPVG